MKICSRCKEAKPLDEFHRNKNTRDGRQSRCKACNRETRNAYYKTPRGKKNNALQGVRQKYRNRLKVFEFLDGKSCVDCGENNPILLEFDHRDSSDKINNISNMMDLGWETIKAEISKCDIRCANCHRMRTAKQFDWHIYNWYIEKYGSLGK